MHITAQNKLSGSEIITYFKSRLGNKLRTLLQKQDNNNLTCYHHATLYGNLAYIKILFEDSDAGHFRSIYDLQTLNGTRLVDLASENKEFGSEILSYLNITLDEHTMHSHEECSSNSFSL